MGIGFLIAVIAVTFWFLLRFFVKRLTSEFLRNAYVKKEKMVVRKTLKIEGIQGIRCKYKIEKLVKSIDGVDAKVNLKTKTLILCYDANISDEWIRACIERAGFSVIEKKDK